jgi:hypothetical protein
MPLDITVTRFPNGATNSAESAGFASLKMNDRSIYHEFIEDFDLFTLAEWTTGGVGTPVAPVLVSGDGGQLQMANSAANGDNNWLQQAQPAWTLVAGKRLFFRARAALNAVTFGSVALGLQVGVTVNNFLTPTNGIFLRKSASNSGMEMVVRTAGVETASGAIGDYTGGLVDVFFAYDGQGNVVAGTGSTPVVSLTPASFPVSALGIVVGVQNTSAASRIMIVDQIFCAKER